MAEEIQKKNVTDVEKEAYSDGVILGVQGGKAVTYDAKEFSNKDISFGKVEKGDVNVVSGVEVFNKTIVKEIVENKLNPDKLENGYIGDWGNVVSYNGAKVSEFIEIIGGDTYHTNFGSYDSGEYDSNKNFISKFENSQGIFKTNKNAKYIRVSFDSSFVGMPLFVWNYSKFGKQEYIKFGDLKVYDYADKEIKNLVVKDVFKNGDKVTAYPLFYANLLDVSKMTNGYLDENGNVVSYNGAKVSEFIEIIGGDTYHINNAIWDSALYDSNKKFIKIVKYNDGILNTTIETKYIRVVIPNDAVTSDAMLYNFEYCNNQQVKYSKYGELVSFMKSKIISFNSVLNGKTINLQGDSIANALFNNNLIQKNTGCKIINYAQDGASYAKRIDETKVISETWYSVNKNSDYNVIWAGVNDTWTPTSLGVKDSTNVNEFYGALNVTLKGMLTNYSESKIAVLLPLQRQNNSILLPYVEALKDRCNFYSIPYLDLNSQGQITPDFSGVEYFPDMLHPNKKGYELILNKIIKFLESI